MIALEFTRSVPRYIAARAVAGRAPGLVPAAAPLRVVRTADPEPPAPGWVRVRPTLAGICGSDLAMIAGHASFYFSPIVSMPFVPGHEIVGTTEDGARVIVEPVLACAARGVDPPCEACARGDTGLCERLAHGHVAPGLQTGFCTDTGGGWGTALVAHRSQIHPVPDDLSDETAVLVEPLACAVHAALRARVQPDDTVLIVGAGTIGLLTIAAVRELTPAGRIVAAAKHPRQRTEAKRLGADEVCAPDATVRAVRLATRALMHTPDRGGPWLAGGADVSLECSGRMDALDTCLRSTRSRGRVVLVGLPGAGRIDLAPVWHRELDLSGAYAYGSENMPGGSGGERSEPPFHGVRGSQSESGGPPEQNGAARRTFDVAIGLARKLDLGPLVSAAYPLTRYREALDHALDAGRLGSVKVVFKP